MQATTLAHGWIMESLSIPSCPPAPSISFSLLFQSLGGYELFINFFYFYFVVANTDFELTTQVIFFYMKFIMHWGVFSDGYSVVVALNSFILYSYMLMCPYLNRVSLCILCF